MSSNWHKNIQTTKSNCLKNILKNIYNNNQNETQDINQLNQLLNKPFFFFFLIGNNSLY